MNNKVDDASQSSLKRVDQSIEKKQLHEIKNIITHIEKTFSQMKIFSSDHENVESFIDLLFDRISKYLNENWKLEIGVEEVSFTFNGIPFYTQKQLSKSLPFLFYKDGIKILFFYKGLSREELKEFLKIMKEDSILPPEESDIVIALWEKDFAHIRYYAPDDYLETKIGVGIEILEYKIDRNKLFSGKIRLKPEDKSALNRKARDGKQLYKKLYGINSGENPSLLSKSEIESLQNMIQNHRKESEENQFKILLLDILYLEKRPEKVESLVNQFVQYMNQQINKGNFKNALALYQELLDLKNYLSEIDPSKEKLIENFFNSPEIEITVPQVEEILNKGLFKELDFFLKYITFMGGKCIPILSYLYDHLQESETKEKIITTLKQVGKENLLELIKIARDERPELTLIIISIFQESKEKRAVHHLARFLSYKNKRVLNAAIKSIGSFKDPDGNKILFPLLSHENQEIKMLAAENIHMTEEDPVFNKILQIVKEKKFKKENRKQKKALLLTLARSDSRKAYDVLEKFIKKVGIFSFPTKVELALCAVEALEKAGGNSGYTILKNMTNSRNKKIRKGCQKAVNSLSQDRNKEVTHDQS